MPAPVTADNLAIEHDLLLPALDVSIDHISRQSLEIRQRCVQIQSRVLTRAHWLQLLDELASATTFAAMNSIRDRYLQERIDRADWDSQHLYDINRLVNDVTMSVGSNPL